jgi:hypothetical protein
LVPALSLLLKVKLTSGLISASLSHVARWRNGKEKPPRTAGG